MESNWANALRFSERVVIVPTGTMTVAATLTDELNGVHGRCGVDGDTPEHDSQRGDRPLPAVYTTAAGSEPADGHQE